jgi:hypothetical protein
LDFTVTGTDPYGGTASFNFEINVIDNKAPEMTSTLNNYTFTNGSAISISFVGIFSDPDRDPLIFYLTENGT